MIFQLLALILYKQTSVLDNYNLSKANSVKSLIIISLEFKDFCFKLQVKKINLKRKFFLIIIIIQTGNLKKTSRWPKN